jgi:uncharacterized protein (DUF58 family)
MADRLRGLGIGVRGRVEGGTQGAHRSPHQGSSVEFSDFREYTRGDPPNLIDWSVFARSDKYVIRRYQEETSLRAFVLLDSSESMAFKEDGAHSKMDYACYLAAGFMYILCSQADSAGLVIFNEGIKTSFPPVRSLANLRPLLLALEGIKPAGRSNIEEMLHKMAEQVKTRSLFILISDCLTDPASILRGIRHMHHNGHEVTVMHLLDPAEMHLNFTGLAELKELETGERLVIEVDEIKDAYAAEVQRFIAELRKGALDCQGDYHLISTKSEIDEVIRRRATMA